MEMYQKPVMEIAELEKIDVLTLSCECPICNNPKVWYIWEEWLKHLNAQHGATLTTNPEYKTYWDANATEHEPPKKQEK